MGSARNSRGRGRGRPGAPRRIAYVYLLPAIVLYAGFVLWPFLRTAWLAFQEWNGISPPQWVGLDNFQTLIVDHRIRGAFANSAILIFFASALPVLLGLLLAATLSGARIRGLTGFRTALILPTVISTVVVGVTWSWIYAPQGVLNQLLDTLGLGGFTHAWLGDFELALPSVGLIGTWAWFGIPMVLFIAGILRISPELYDAARVDGAGPFQSFRAVTLPGLRGQILVAVTLTVIGALGTFGIVVVTTNGGPGSATTVPALEIFRRAFQYGQIGPAAAIAITLAAVMLVFSVTINHLGETDDAGEE